MIEEESDRGNRNRVLVDLPARLRKAKSALREYETLIGDLRLLYSQRLLLKDSVVLDQIGDRLNMPRMRGDRDGE